MDDFFTLHGCKPGCHFLSNCSEVNSTGYSEFKEPISARQHFHCFSIQLFQKTLSKEKLKSHKPRPQGSMGSFKSVFIAAIKRELKKPRRQRRGQRLKKELIFYVRISRYPKVIYFVYHCQNYHETESRTHQ